MPTAAPTAGGGGRCAGLTGQALWTCRANNQPPPTGGGSGTPQTLQQLLARFYTSNFKDYVNTGNLAAGVPQPQGTLLDLLAGQGFQNLIARYEQPPQSGGRQGEVPFPTRQLFLRPGDVYNDQAHRGLPTSVLGLSGGAAAYGYIDPAWMFDKPWTGAGTQSISSLPATILAQQPSTGGLPMNGLIRGGPAGGPVQFGGGGVSGSGRCVGLTGQALWTCRQRAA